MNHRIWALYTVLAVLTSTAVAADQGSFGGQVNGIEIGKTTPQENAAAEPTSRSHCINRCNAADTKCGSAVRRARSECSRNAATNGRDPFTGRNDDDYTAFCSHFGNPMLSCDRDAYSRGCQARYQQRYGICVDAMYNNIAAMRFDCFRGEREAQRFCRDELHDCKAACPGDPAP